MRVEKHIIKYNNEYYKLIDEFYDEIGFDEIIVDFKEKLSISCGGDYKKFLIDVKTDGLINPDAMEDKEIDEL